MATELGQAYVQIMPSAKGISGSITQAIGGEATSAGQSAGSTIGSKIKGALIAAGIGKVLKDTIMEGANLEQSIGGIETLFKKSASTVEKYAVNAWKTAGLSANSYMEMATSFSASLLQSLSGDTKKAAKITDMAIKDMSDNANKMGTDMESIQWAYQGFAKQNYTMLDNLKLGYGGTKSEMERLLADAQELTGVKYDINNLADVYNAIHVIQGELGITGTTAKEAEKTIIGSFNSMKAAAQNLMGELVLGGQLQSVNTAMKNLVQSACTFLFDNLFPAIGNIVASLPAAIGTFLVEAIPKIAVQGKTMIEALIEGINENIPKFASTFPKAVQAWLDKLEESGPSILEKAGKLMLKLGNAILNNIPLLLQALGEIWSSLGAWLDANSGKFGAKIGELIGKLVQTIISHTPDILAAAWKLFVAIVNVIGELPVYLREIAVEAIKSFVKELIPDKVATKAKSIKNAFLHPIETLRDKVGEIVRKIQGFFNFSVKTPHIPLPHFSIKPKGWSIGDLLKGKIPSLSLKWYKTGGIFSDPSVIGVGEAGSEAVVPLDKFWAKLDRMVEAIEKLKSSGETKQVVNIYQPVKTPIETARAIKKQMEQGLAGA